MDKEYCRHCGLEFTELMLRTKRYKRNPDGTKVCLACFVSQARKRRKDGAVALCDELKRREEPACANS